MAPNDPSGPELDLSRPGSLAALYLRVATTLERSADLAEQHAARLTGNGRDELANVELEGAARHARPLNAAAISPRERGNAGSGAAAEPGAAARRQQAT